MLYFNSPPHKLFWSFRRPQLWSIGDWQLHHDHRTTHASYVVHSSLVKHQIAQVTQPHSSPDLAPCDFWPVQKLKSPFKGGDFRLSVIFRKMLRAADGNWENGVRSQGASLKGAKASLSYVQCFLYLLQ